MTLTWPEISDQGLAPSRSMYKAAAPVEQHGVELFTPDFHVTPGAKLGVSQVPSWGCPKSLPLERGRVLRCCTLELPGGEHQTRTVSPFEESLFRMWLPDWNDETF